MKTSGLQNLINNIFHDEAIKRKFLDDPQSVMSAYDLTTQEKAALLKTQPKLGLVADSVQLESELGPLSFWT